ncbi:MAG: riboflavin synthase [Fimbriimonadaceae bacterium]|nr:riboflavin synthase [Fimbriimonadaceae bacterium]
MFTGIVEEVGHLVAVEARGNLTRWRVRAQTVLADARLGDSIAHNGVCLTISELAPPVYACDLMQETLRHTTLGALRPGAPVNLERALAVGGRFGGHFVQGHVDAVGQIVGLERTDRWVTYRIGASPAVLRFVVAKGSVAVDGTSLTVVERLADSFTVSLIPHTLAVTCWGQRQVGDAVNLEPDILAKYVAAAVAAPGADGDRGTMSWQWLAERGFGME